MSFGGKAARGGAVTLAGQGVKFIVQAVTLVVLSRLLSPEAFGVVAILTAVVAFTELFRDFGLTPAAIHADTLTREQSSNLFWINVAIGALIGCFIAASGHLLAAVYGEPQLIEIAPVLGASSLIIGVGAQYRVSLTRDLRFTALTVTELIGQCVGAVVAISMALAGGGVWALAFQALATQIALFISRALASSWQPGRPSRGANMRGFFRYGGNLFASQGLTYLAGNVDTYLIGLNWGAVTLGLYNRAFTLMTLPLRQSLTPLTNVFLPILSRLNKTPSRYFQALLNVQFALGGGVVFAYAMAVAYAPELVTLVLGGQWSESATLFRLLAIGGAFQIFSHLNYWVFLSMGATGSLLRYNLVTKIFTVALIVVASFFSVEAVAAAYAASLALSWPINVIWLKRAVGMPVQPFLGNGLTILIAGALSLSVASAIHGLNVTALSLAAVPAALGVYVGVLCVSRSTRPQLLTLVRRAKDRIRRVQD